MSSKKVASKETKAKKPTAKKTAVAKPAPKKSAAKPAAKAPAKKAAAAKPAPQKSAAKPAAKPATKVAPKKAAKPAAKAPANAAPKSAPKNAAKPAAKDPAKKAAVAKPAPKKSTAKPAAKPATKAAQKSAPKNTAKPAVKAPAKKAAATKPAKPAKDIKKNATKSETEAASPVKGVAPKDVKPVTKTPAPVVDTVVENENNKHQDKKPKVEYDYAVLLQGVKKLSKTAIFVKIDEQEDRSNKKKMSSELKNLDMKPTAAIRHKASLAEETQEELTERILKELEEQNMIFEREAATQMCTRCNRNLVSPEFWVDKHLGYCEECAAILKLGQSKEARKVEYQLGSMGGDSLDEEEDDDIMGPDADDLKEAEEDLAEMGE